MANINISVRARANTTPTINNFTIKGANRVTYPIPLNNFIVDGGYSDSEGDTMGSMKVVTLPTSGSLVYGNNNTPVTVGQIVTANDLNNNLLKYIPFNGTYEKYSTSFNFQVTDSVDYNSFSQQRVLTLDTGEAVTVGYGFTGGPSNYVASENFSINLAWNSTVFTDYKELYLGLIRYGDSGNIIDSLLWNGTPATKIVIESITDGIVLTNDMQKFWENTVDWTPLPSGFNAKQIINSSTGQPITFPYTINLPNGNAPVDNLGLKVDFTTGELIVPTPAVNSPNPSFNRSIRRIFVAYKIYSGNTALTPTLYTMWTRFLTKP